MGSTTTRRYEVTGATDLQALAAEADRRAADHERAGDHVAADHERQYAHEMRQIADGRIPVCS